MYKCFDHEWEGPSLGPKPTGEIKEWSEAILRASEAIVPSQYGSNKFASAAGIRFGAQRDIINNVHEKEGGFTKNTPPVPEAEA